MACPPKQSKYEDTLHIASGAAAQHSQLLLHVTLESSATWNTLAAISTQSDSFYPSEEIKIS